MILSFLDYILTAKLLNQYGSEAEANLVAKYVYETFGHIGLALLKVISVVVVLCIIVELEKKNVKWGLFVKVIACLSTGLAVVLGFAYA